MVFLTSRSASKHDIFALGVDPTARDTGFQPSLTNYAIRSARLVASRPCSLATQVYSIAKHRKTSSKCCRVYQ